MSLILTIDDEPQILELLEAMLSYEGHEVISARDGGQGLALLSTDVNLVITDLIMPNTEGLETIREIRQQGLSTPIIAMTGGGLVGPRDYLETARFIGADAVVAKPFSRGEMLRPVRDLLSRSKAGSALA